MSVRPPGGSGLSKSEKRVLYPGVGLLLTAILVLVGLGASAIANGDVEKANSYAQFLGGFGTIGLILLTGWYAYQTRRMVNQQWRMHEEEIEHRRERQLKEENALRRALKEEIGKVAYLDEFAEKYSRGHSRLEDIIPKEVYESNGQQLGLLTEQEVDVVVEYYTRARGVENLMRIQKQEDTTAGVNQIMEMFYISEYWIDVTLKVLSLGRYTPKWEEREETIREHLKQLADAQERAVSNLEENLEETP